MSREDALQASRAVMHEALTRLAWYSEDEKTRNAATEALLREHLVYTEAVRKDAA